MRTFVIGDIHGCLKTFEQLLGKIDYCQSDKLILLGDYIDRGPEIKETIDFILTLKKDNDKVIPLIGNHESMLLKACYNESLKHSWFLNGGKNTLNSFHLSSPEEFDKVYINFFNNLKYYHSENNMLFVHAGFNEDLRNPFDDKESMIWLRKENYSSDFFKNKIIIHGHTPIHPEILLNRIKEKFQVINLDTGCVYNQRKGFGFLSALNLSNFKITFQKNHY